MLHVAAVAVCLRVCAGSHSNLYCILSIFSGIQLARTHYATLRTFNYHVRCETSREESHNDR